MKNIFSMRKGKLGKIFVKYAEPIDLNTYIANSKVKSMEKMALNLTRELYYVQQKEQPITMNSLISTSLFYQPEQQVTFNKIKGSIDMLYSYIQDSQLKNYISTTPSNYEINNAALNLGFKVIGNPEDRKKGGEAVVSMKNQ